MSLLTLAKLSDLPVLLEMVREYHSFDHLDFDPALITRLLNEILENDRLGRAYMIREPENQAVIGYTLLTFGFSLEYRGKNAFIDELFLREPFRGKGLGRRVLTELFSQGAALGLNTLHLEVEKKNPNAVGLYRKMHFKDQDRLLMTRWL